FYVVRERRRLWSSLPSAWIIVSMLANVAIFTALAAGGILMSPIPLSVIGAVLAATIVFTFVLDALKAAIGAHLKMQ
ncbi:MAG: hypothetical protein ACYCT1_20220, partial [Steroidobacteraceae bacterium]